MPARGRQFEFTLAELAALALSFLVTSALVFLLGFYVGREVESEHLPAPDIVARVPVGEPPDERPQAIPPMPELARPSPAQDAGRTRGARAERSGSESGRGEQRGESRPEGEPKGPPVPYTVQVLATRDLKEAEALSRQLKRRGVGAFVTAVEGQEGKWYRVRIGRYDDLAAAQRMAERCRREFGLAQAYVSAMRDAP